MSGVFKPNRGKGYNARYFGPKHAEIRVLKFEIRNFESSNNFVNKFEFDRRTPKPSYSNI